MKICTKCKVAKPATVEFFSPTVAHSSVLRASCRECRNAAVKAHQKANPEKVKADKAARYKANPEKEKVRSAAWKKANPGKVKARSAAWNKANPEKAKTMSAVWRKANPEKVNAYAAAWRQSNPEKSKAKAAAWKKANPEKARARSAAWQKANPARMAAHSNKRKAAKLQAIPKWYDEKKTQAVYARAAAKTKATGIKHHTDHIVPLQSKFVCGLHWHKNLRVIPASKNISKGNRYWDNMP